MPTRIAATTAPRRTVEQKIDALWPLSQASVDEMNAIQALPAGAVVSLAQQKHLARAAERALKLARLAVRMARGDYSGTD